MPLTPQMMRLLHVTVSLQALALVILIGMLTIVFQVTPYAVLEEVKNVRTEVNISTETVRKAISVNQEQIEKLKSQMKIRTEMLMKANERLKKLDPTFVPEPIED
jgi:Cu/Ag efflux protein CusF